ncbi:MAG: agmatinase [Acidimicrobiia bacterium]
MAEQLDAPQYQGLLSFGKFPYLTEPSQLDEFKPDVAVVGAPYDANVSNRPGARFGPAALRSNWYHPGTYNIDLGVEIFDYLTCVDFADAICKAGMWDISRQSIEDRVYEVTSRSIFSIALGGDHSIAVPSVTAVAKKYGMGNVGMIHFDAHADTGNIIDGNLYSHGTPMRRLIESGVVNGKNFIQVGLRGYWPGAEEFAWMKDQGMRWHTCQDIWDKGIKSVLREAIDQALEGTQYLYLSVDVDVLDPSIAPGTGTPEPGGMTSTDLLRCVRQIAYETNLVGMDIVELSPPYDVSETTINVAHRVVWEVLSGLAAKKRDTK